MVTGGPQDRLLTLDGAGTYNFRNLAGAKPTKDLDRAVEFPVAASATPRFKGREAATDQFERMPKAPSLDLRASNRLPTRKIR